MSHFGNKHEKKVTLPWKQSGWDRQHADHGPLLEIPLRI